MMSKRQRKLVSEGKTLLQKQQSAKLRCQDLNIPKHKQTLVVIADDCVLKGFKPQKGIETIDSGNATIDKV